MPFFLEEIAMAKVNISRMDVQSLIDLRKRVDERLLEHRAEIQKQLERMDLIGGETGARRGKRSPLSGRTIKPKYRGPKGETWAGRGARPTWLVAATKEGKKLENFLIDKSAQKARKKA